MRLAPILLLFALSGGCAPYYANLAKSFGGVVRSPSMDLMPMLHGITTLCRRQADLAYLRARLQAPADGKVVWRERMTPRYGAVKDDPEARCAALAQQVQKYQQMYGTIVAYGASLQALAESESTDFRTQFTILGNSMSMLARQIDDDPDLGQALSGGASAINELLRLSLAARSESDIKQAVLRAEKPVDRLLERLERAVQVYNERVALFVQTQQALTDRIELSTRPDPGPGPGPGATARSVDLLAFYTLAQRLAEEEGRLQQSGRLYTIALGSLRGAHSTMVKAARGKVPARQALLLLQQSFRGLFLEISDMLYDAQRAYLRRAGEP